MNSIELLKGNYRQMIEDTTLSIEDIERLEELLQTKKKTAPKVVACQCVPGQCNCQQECH